MSLHKSWRYCTRHVTWSRMAGHNMHNLPRHTHMKNMDPSRLKLQVRGNNSIGVRQGRNINVKIIVNKKLGEIMMFHLASSSRLYWTR